MEDPVNNGVCSPGTDCYKDLSALVLKDCRSLLAFEAECPKKCTKSLKLFFDKHPQLKKSFEKCSCGDDFDCITHRRRFSRCLNDEFIVKNRSSCQHQKYRCLKHKKSECFNLWMDSFSKCESFQTGGKCTEECKQSRIKLYKNKIGKRMRNCICDGEYYKEKYCLKVRSLQREKCGEL